LVKRWILDLDISLLLSGIARKHGIVPKPFLGCPQYFPLQKKSIFFQEQEISREKEFVASQLGDYKKIFLIVQTYLEGQSLCSPHLTPKIQCLPGIPVLSGRRRIISAISPRQHLDCIHPKCTHS
jgi:hypothetical protein